MPENKWEPIYDANMPGGWMCEFTKDGWIVDFTTTMKKIEERKKYDKVWELIKKKNGWS